MTSLSVPATEGAAARKKFSKSPKLSNDQSREGKNEVRAAVFMTLLAVSSLFLLKDVLFRVPNRCVIL